MAFRGWFRRKPLMPPRPATPPGFGAGVAIPTAPFRGEEIPVRYVCTVCWKTAASAPGLCSRDGAPMEEIEPVSGDTTLLWELRSRAKEKRERQLSPSVGELDPDIADATSLVRWLGLKVE